MFSSKQPDKRDQSETYAGNTNVTVIARGVRLQGDFTSQGDVLIDGTVEGRVTTTAQLTVGPEAKLKADLSANDAVIAGVIEGALIVKRRLELKTSASVIGDITCETAAIEAGAVLNGKVMIGGKPPVKSPTPTKSAAGE